MSERGEHGEPSRHPAAGPAATRLAPADRPPSVDALARRLASSGLPHPLLVDVAREAIAAGDAGSAPARAEQLRRALLQRVINVVDEDYPTLSSKLDML